MFLGLIFNWKIVPKIEPRIARKASKWGEGDWPQPLLDRFFTLGAICRDFGAILLDLDASRGACILVVVPSFDDRKKNGREEIARSVKGINSDHCISGKTIHTQRTRTMIMSDHHNVCQKGCKSTKRTQKQRRLHSLSGLKRWLQSKPTRLMDGSIRALILILTHFRKGQLSERLLI